MTKLRQFNRIVERIEKACFAFLVIMLFCPGVAHANHLFLHELEQHHPHMQVGHDLREIEEDFAHLGKDSKGLKHDFQLGEKIAEDVNGGDSHIARVKLAGGDPLNNLFHDEQKLRDDKNKTDELVRDTKKAECDRLAFEYYFEHPPGTKPQGLSGKHGCALYKQNAHWHDEHPNVISFLGINVGIGAGGAGFSF